MMNVIRILPDHIANQIAAGEVIQRPASVVKELVENAIDAGSTEIIIHIKDAGKTLISVQDNGFGMSESDAQLAFERHATSKITNADDLFSLKTKGFRGEALASIAAIAHVNLQTKREKDELGVSIDIEGSERKNYEQVLIKNGSCFAVKNLFFNVPARRNFLKSDAVEFGHIEEEFKRIALPHPEIKFQLIHNDQLLYHLEPAKLRKRIIDVLGSNHEERILPLEIENELVTINGFIGRPEFSKKTRGDQYFFVNNRFFKDSFFNHAILKAYDNLLMPRTFPSYVIFFDIKPEEIDVNVHPTKTEIKFENDKYIYQILKSTVKESLGRYFVSPTLDFDKENAFDLPWDYAKTNEIKPPSIQVDKTYNPFNKNYTKNENSPGILNNGFQRQEISSDDWQNFYSIEEEEKIEQENLELDLVDTRKVIFHGEYILTSTKSGFLCINYRRAKERILFDEINAQFILHPIASQQLLFPINLNLKASDLILLKEQKVLLNQLGFDFQFSDNELLVNGIPVYLNENEIQYFFEELIQEFNFKEIEKSDIAHIFILKIAKNASFTKFEKTQDNANALIDQLFSCSENEFTFEGELIYKTILIQDITKKF